jgi:hypothetical protein
MSLFEDLSKDWKQQKGWPSDLNTESIKKKNLIEIVRREKAELRFALILGGLSIIAMVLTGTVYPVAKGFITLNPYIIIGASIIAASLLAFVWASRRAAFALDLNKVSKDCLLDAKKKIEYLGSTQGKLGITYTLQLLAGMCLLNFGILSQFPETNCFWLYLMPFGFGLLGLVV